MDTIIWLALMIIFLIVEAACPIHLVSIWFAAGSFCAVIATILGAPIWLQIAIFLAVSCVLLAALWPFKKKFLNPRITKTNVDSIIGTEGYVTQVIDNLHATGQVKLGGMEWTARSQDGSIIQEGTLVKVEKIEGVKAIVSLVEVKV